MSTLLDGVYEEVVDDAPEIAEALLAGAVPIKPPKTWFDDPGLEGPTPLTVTSSGQVYGHIALWNVDHIGIPGSRKPPRSASNYAFFRTGVIETDDGTDVPVGQITRAGGHAGLNADAGTAVKHYDDTATAFADVAAGEDVYGIYVAGAARPGVSEEDIRAIRASAPSGDWRPINGQLEMVAVCQVNVPGFPVVRSMVAGGEILSLVAAGAAPLYALRQEEALIASVKVLESRVTRLEDDRTRRRAQIEEKRQTMTTVVASAGMNDLERMQSRLAEVKRMKLDERMTAMRDGDVGPFDGVTASGTRKVRTEAGKEHFDQPIGTVIIADSVLEKAADSIEYGGFGYDAQDTADKILSWRGVPAEEVIEEIDAMIEEDGDMPTWMSEVGTELLMIKAAAKGSKASIVTEVGPS